MLELQSITHRYGEKTVLQGLSHRFPESGAVLLTAPSGVGKTTLLRLIAGLEAPTEGTVHNSYSRVAMCFQEPRLLPWLSCLDNVKLVLANAENADETARLWLERMELSDVSDKLPETLSGGMKQRLSLARALAFGGDLLLLDEPFTALDESLKCRIVPWIKAANPLGLTLIVSHNAADAALLGATTLTLIGCPAERLI